jgi:hypothetical protein
MNSYLILLDISDESGRYFLAMDVASDTERRAVELALSHAHRMEVASATVDEVEMTTALTQVGEEGVLKVYGRSYYSLEGGNSD